MADPKRPGGPPDAGPPPILKAVVIGLIAGALSLSLELVMGGDEPDPWRSLGIAFGLGAGYLAYEVWLRRRRKMLAEGRNPDDPTRTGG